MFLGVEIVRGESVSSPGKTSLQFKVIERPSHYKLNVYTFGLHGKMVQTARCILKKVRKTRKSVRITRLTGLKRMFNKEKLKSRRKVTPKKRVVNLSDVGTVGYVTSLFQVDKLLRLFGLRIIPEDGYQARQVLFPHMKLVHKFAILDKSSSSDTPEKVVEKIRHNKRKQRADSSSENEGNDTYDEGEKAKHVQDEEYDEELWIHKLNLVDESSNSHKSEEAVRIKILNRYYAY